MPRNVSGTYTLPLPPVVPTTVIQSAWANTTDDDLAQALTDSLDRNGRGGMIAPFRLVDGTPIQPAWAFAAETGTGMFRVSPGVLGVAVAGAQVGQWTSAGYTGAIAGPITLTGPITITGGLTLDTLNITGDINSNGNFFIDDTVDAPLRAVVTNHSAGVNAASEFVAVNDTADVAQLVLTSSGFTGFPLAGARAGLLSADGSGGLVLNAANVAGTIRFATGGTIERMRLDAAGNLGIGATTLSAALEVARGAAVTTTFLLRGNGVAAGSGFAIQQLFDNSAAIYLRANAAMVFGTNSATRMTLTAGGSLGIGNTNPTAGKLVVGNSADASNTVEVQVSATGIAVYALNAVTSSVALVNNQSGATFSGIPNGTGGVTTSSATTLVFAPNATERMRIDGTSGSVGIGTTTTTAGRLVVGNSADASNNVTVQVSTAGVASYTLDAGASGTTVFANNKSGAAFLALPNGSAGFITTGATPLSFVLGGAERVQISTAGLVGIGITPVANLDVFGTSAYVKVHDPAGSVGYLGSGLLCGTGAVTDTALRWDGGNLLITGPGAVARVIIPASDAAPILIRQASINYIMALDPGVGPNVPVGAIITATAGGTTFTSGLGSFTTIALAPVLATLTLGAFAGGVSVTLTAGTFRNIGIVNGPSGIGTWIRVA